MNTGKIIVCLNNQIAFPALRELLFYQLVSAIIIPSKNAEVILQVNELVADNAIEIITVKRSDHDGKLKDAINRLNPIAVLIMTFPYVLSQELIELPPKGFINFHYGRLPEYRGPEPIFTQIVKGEKNPGVTVHIITEKLDAGPIILQDTVPYDENDTYNLLQEKLAYTGAKLVNTLMKIFSYGNFLPSTPQDESKAVYYPKPGLKDVMISWQTMDSRQVKCLVNACNPWNKGCGLKIGEQVFGVLEVEIDETGNGKNTPGIVVQLNKEQGLKIAAKDGKLVKINILYNNAVGFISGHRLAMWGVQPGQDIN